MNLPAMKFDTLSNAALSLRVVAELVHRGEMFVKADGVGTDTVTITIHEAVKGVPKR